MLQINDKEALSTQATENKRNQDISARASSVGGRNIDGDIKNLSFIVKLAKSKKPIFAKTNFFGTDFLITGAKKAFIHLQKAFTKASIFKYFDLKRHIWTEINASGYAIGEVFSQMILNQSFSDHLICKNHSNFSKSEIHQ